MRPGPASRSSRPRSSACPPRCSPAHHPTCGRCTPPPLLAPTTSSSSRTNAGRCRRCSNSSHRSATRWSTNSASSTATAWRSPCATTRSGSSPSPRSPRSAPSRCRSTPGGRPTRWSTGCATRAPRWCSPTRSAWRGCVPPSPDPRRGDRRRPHRRRRRRAPTGSVGRLEELLVAGAEMPDVDDRPRRRRHDPLHLGHDRPPKGAVSTHRAVISGLMAFACKAPSERCARPEANRRPTDPPAFILCRPALPRHRLRAGHARVARVAAQAGDDVQVGPGPRPRAHRAGAGDELRRRADDELGPARAPRASPTATPRACSPSAAAGRRCRRSWCGGSRTRSRGARPQLGYGMTETNAYGPRQHRRRLRAQAHQHRAGRADHGIAGRRPERQPAAAG